MERSPWVEAYERELHTSSARSVVIVLSAIIEENLKLVVMRHFTSVASKDDRLFGDMRPLSTFSSIIEVAYRLGFLDKEVRDILNIVKKLRNECAHSSGIVKLEKSPFSDRIRSIAAKLPSLRISNQIPPQMAFNVIALCFASCFHGIAVKLEELGSERIGPDFVQLKVVDGQLTRYGEINENS